jgi:4-amino-4-deoxy-L-arabinose transferase-like glycosyltransferase
VTMWQDYRGGSWKGWLLPLALVATVAEQIHILNSYPTWGQWLIPLLVVLSILAVGWLVSVLIATRLPVKAPGTRSRLAALSLGVLALLLSPTVWAALPVIQPTPAQANLPVAGPSQREGFGGNFGGSRNVDPALIGYLEANQGHASFLVATLSSMTADGIILATNKPVMAMGGFAGGDPILTTNQLASLVAQGTVRFFLVGTRRQLSPQQLDQLPQQLRNRVPQGWPGFGGQQSALTTWVTQHCTTVPANLWQSATTRSSASGDGGPFGANQLYDCATIQ